MEKKERSMTMFVQIIARENILRNGKRMDDVEQYLYGWIF